jgi:hypothetical protein
MVATSESGGGGAVACRGGWKRGPWSHKASAWAVGSHRASAVASLAKLVNRVLLSSPPRATWFHFIRPTRCLLYYSSDRHHREFVVRYRYKVLLAQHTCTPRMEGAAVGTAGRRVLLTSRKRLKDYGTIYFYRRIRLLTDCVIFSGGSLKKLPLKIVFL